MLLGHLLFDKNLAGEPGFVLIAVFRGLSVVFWSQRVRLSSLGNA